MPTCNACSNIIKVVMLTVNYWHWPTYMHKYPSCTEEARDATNYSNPNPYQPLLKITFLDARKVEKRNKQFDHHHRPRLDTPPTTPQWLVAATVRALGSFPRG